MKKAVAVITLLTALVMGGCAGKGGAGTESTGGGGSSVEEGQDRDGTEREETDRDGEDGDDAELPAVQDEEGSTDDDQSAAYDIEKIYPDELMKKIIEGEEMPMVIGYGLGGESGYVTAMSQDTEIIGAFIDGLRELSIKSISTPDQASYVADGGEDIIFGMEDGSQFDIALDGRQWIHTDSAVYELADTAALSEVCAMMQEIAYMNDAGGITPGDYIVCIRGGVGERTKETYVYETEEGYKYINVTSTTVSWGSPKWDHEVEKTGTVSTKEEVVEAAKKHGADSCITYPGSFDAHPISDFLGK